MHLLKEDPSELLRRYGQQRRPRPEAVWTLMNICAHCLYPMWTWLPGKAYLTYLLTWSLHKVHNCTCTYVRMYCRLPIICLEDVLLHPGLPLLTWLMAAQAKGYVLGEAAASEVLRITYQIAAVRVTPLVGNYCYVLGEATASEVLYLCHLPDSSGMGRAACLAALMMTLPGVRGEASPSQAGR